MSEEESPSQPVPEKAPLDPFEATTGLRHRDIIHLLEILDNPQAPKPNKIKAMRLLNEVLPGRQHEADMHGAIDILRPYLMQPPNGLLLHALVCFTTLINTADLARKMLDDVPRIVEIIAPDVEPPLRCEAAKLLRIIAEFTGPERQFTGPVVTSLVEAIASRESKPEFLVEAYGLLGRLANKQTVRVPLTESSEALAILVQSLADPLIRNSALMCAANIAMDQNHKGKRALLDAEILPSLAKFLESSDDQLRLTVLSLISLLAVPKEGKNDIATDESIPELVKNIIANDANEDCRKAAERVRVLVSELPLGKAIMGGEGE